MSRAIFYVSGHGFGHAVRDAELIRSLKALAPDLSLEVRTTAPAWIFPPGVPVVRRELDVGVVQPDSLRVEAGETLDRYAALLRDEPARIEAELDDLRATGVSLVLADVPPAAFEIAALLSVPVVGLANFCWDWIYQPYLRTRPARAPLLNHIRAQHARASLLLRLPFHGGLSCFPRAVDVPLIGRQGSPDKGGTRRRLGLPTDRPLVLLSFGGFDFAGLASAPSALPSGYAFVAAHAGPSRREGNLYLIPREAVCYLDLLAASDAVVAKLGYGIAVDCLANRVPILYTPRGQFREEPLLGRELERHGRALRLPRSVLRRWVLGPWLERLMSLDRPWAELRLDGADVAARHILDLLA